MSELLTKYVLTGSLGGNVYMECDGFGISYNASPGIISAFAGDNDSDETAIVSDDGYFILNGDFREEYARIAEQGFAACLRFFLSNPELISSWSRTADEARLVLGEIA